MTRRAEECYEAVPVVAGWLLATSGKPIQRKKVCLCFISKGAPRHRPGALSRIYSSGHQSISWDSAVDIEQPLSRMSAQKDVRYGECSRIGAPATHTARLASGVCPVTASATDLPCKALISSGEIPPAPSPSVEAIR